MDVPSKCTIVRTIDRSACAREVLSGRNRAKIETKPQNHTIGKHSTQSSSWYCSKRKK
jgi:hypothetical protein